MAVEMYLKVPGVAGGSHDTGHVGSIQILAWSWGLENSGTAVSGAGKATWQDLSVTAYVDTATSPLMLSIMRGSVFDSMLLSTVYASPSTRVDKIAMTDVITNSGSLGGSGGEDQFTVNWSFSFAAATFTFAGKQWEWDLSTNSGG